jgi:myo-inositol 2-dehydrogenase/D-chiro-inositol 1-dehydrogenase
MSIRFAILGAGRIGQVHARAVDGNENAVLAAVFDPVEAAAALVADRYGAEIRDLDAIAAADDIDAVVICTPTDLHAQQIEQFARAGKAVFCEKPIDLDSARVRGCLAVVEATGATLMVGFNRRFDPHFMGVKAAIEDGSIGAPEMGIITSRDPGAPPADYITRSGGIFKDMMIHDFDMAVFLMGDMPESVMATGSVLTDKSIEALGDFDSASAVLRWADGRQLSISNSRRATYGYDQRVEMHGALGMVAAENEHPVRIELATAGGYTRPPLHDFFMTRYIAAYANEINAFISAVGGAAGGIPTGIDGLNALLIAEAALESAQTGRFVTIAS